MLSGKPISKYHLLYDSICVMFSEWQYYRHREQISGEQGLVMAEENRDIFVEMESYCALIMVLVTTNLHIL